MTLLYMLEEIRTPFLDQCFLLITRLGEETVFLFITMVIFWCVSKQAGYYLMSVGFLGTVTSQFLKLTFRIPRPWVLDPDFTILENARAAATGYSFPSGHSQAAVGTFGVLATSFGNTWIQVIGIAVSILVPLSRLYLGVHTLEDVLAGAGISLVLIFLLRPIFTHHNFHMTTLLLGGMVVLALGNLFYTEFWPFPANVDPQNLRSATENAYTLMGALSGLCVVFWIDERKLQFDVHAPLPGQIGKVVLGLCAVLVVKEGLAIPLHWIFAGHLIEKAILYFLVVLTAGVLWPLTFPWFSHWKTEIHNKNEKGI